LAWLTPSGVRMVQPAPAATIAMMA